MEQQFTSNQDEEALVTLVGHSLGGYLAARYIWKYHPSYVRRLVLASPVGFPPRPLNSLEGAQLPTSLRIVDALWSRNWTPQQLVRVVGAQRGRRSVQRALRARLPYLPSASADVLAEYLYYITVAEPSGEFAMNSLLEPVATPDVMGVFAREPLSSILTFKNAAAGSGSVRAISNSTSLSSIKVLFGEHDWMRPNNNETTARETLLQMQELNPGIEEAQVDIVPNAGHHLYLENPNNFVRHIVG
jgi:cardiolipin-specific phospholipase